MTTSKITSDSIQDNTITSQNIQDNAVSDSKLASTLDLTGKSISMTDLNLDAGFGSTAPVYGVRAWVNFDGTTNTGGNCTIRASGNVSSVTDNGTGDYTINFTSAMPDANYSVACAGQGDPVYSPQGFTTMYNRTSNIKQSPTTSNFRITNARLTDGLPLDSEFCQVAVFR